MSEKAYTMVTRKVFDGGEGASVEIYPHDEFMVGVRTTADSVSVEWFGKFETSFSPKVARAVAEAMLKCADEIEP